MKRVVLTIVDFFKNLFTAKKKIAKVEVTFTESEPSKLEEEVEQELKDLFCKSKDFETKDISLEIQDVTTETDQVIVHEYIQQSKEWSNKKRNKITVANKDYMLTDKQLFFYVQFASSKQPLHGNKVAREFVYNISIGYSDDEFKAIPKNKFKIFSHKETMVGLLKNGLLKEVSKNTFEAIK